jgi:thiol-disulfide isomerase/thioredoxin
MDLLERVANHFNNVNTFVVTGTATAAIPGTSWRASYKFETQDAQPASYCGVCKRTTLYAQALAKRYQSSGLAVLTLTQDSAADARLWTDYNHVLLPVVLDSDGSAFKAFEIQGVPVTILIDADGKVAHYWVGLDDPASMEPVVQANQQAHSAPAAGETNRH